MFYLPRAMALNNQLMNRRHVMKEPTALQARAVYKHLCMHLCTIYTERSETLFDHRTFTKFLHLLGTSLHHLPDRACKSHPIESLILVGLLRVTSLTHVPTTAVILLGLSERLFARTSR